MRALPNEIVEIIFLFRPSYELFTLIDDKNYVLSHLKNFEYCYVQYFLYKINAGFRLDDIFINALNNKDEEFITKLSPYVEERLFINCINHNRFDIALTMVRSQAMINLCCVHAIDHNRIDCVRSLVDLGANNIKELSCLAASYKFDDIVIFLYSKGGSIKDTLYVPRNYKKEETCTIL